MRFSKCVFAAGLCLAQAASADCFVCDEVVELDQAAAQCFVDQSQTYLERAKQARGHRTEVDLSTCTGASTDNGRGLDSFVRLPGSAGKGQEQRRKRIRTVYVLDVQAITCVQAILNTRSAPIDPSLTIDLIEECE
ncbi:hypothetical protein [Thalassovita sp.]|uniref:hypothetical protein n=1 Tax=Thalassovita sp. TaxID=1979401 RepID=UPI002881BCD9|nr:hypothetical protein [Thalassovita sp.]MDF1804344.1 hypothetical protein [Thalassovita sp.]